MKNENLKQRNENEVTDRAKVKKFTFFIFLFLVLVASLKSVSELYLLCSELCFYFFPKPFHILTKFRLCALQNYDFHNLNLTRKPLAERGQQFGLEIDSHFSEQTACWQPQR